MTHKKFPYSTRLHAMLIRYVNTMSIGFTVICIHSYTLYGNIFIQSDIYVAWTNVCEDKYVGIKLILKIKVNTKNGI